MSVFGFVSQSLKSSTAPAVPPLPSKNPVSSYCTVANPVSCRPDGSFVSGTGFSCVTSVSITLNVSTCDLASGCVDAPFVALVSNSILSVTAVSVVPPPDVNLNRQMLPFIAIYPVKPPALSLKPMAAMPCSSRTCFNV